MAKFKLTKRLRGIHAAWHFWLAVSFGGESDLRKLGLCGIHPLTQRYVYMEIKGLNVSGSSSLFLWQFVPSRLSKSALSA
ncbi:TPA: DUF3265 domain-containing protein [Vibrio vulnificus]|nr:DUF3265 domain-containing protein [Vibrio vulnificus]HDY8062762.1 DUF3265 domain-containing protein [Vibrio vulnificus]HDY8081820.1 DUF3265 domain-containing protein [Vibrio vulnificus]HDY8192788.1 DUF3265 domain-containing protein [Vibrio vulnificus]